MMIGAKSSSTLILNFTPVWEKKSTPLSLPHLPVKPMNHPSVLLVGPLTGLDPQFPVGFAPLHFGLPLGLAFRGFLVKQCRFAGGAALGLEGGDGDVPSILVFADGKPRANADVFSRLGALAVEVDFAAIDRFGGECAGLEKSGGPEPFVETHGLIMDIVSIFVVGMMSRHGKLFTQPG